MAPLPLLGESDSQEAFVVATQPSSPDPVSTMEIVLSDVVGDKVIDSDESCIVETVGHPLMMQANSEIIASVRMFPGSPFWSD